jgi:hypothetical protein
LAVFAQFNGLKQVNYKKSAGIGLIFIINYKKYGKKANIFIMEDFCKNPKRHIFT